MKEQKSPAIAIYSRKSRFTGKGESIENQIEPVSYTHLDVYKRQIL